MKLNLVTSFFFLLVSISIFTTVNASKSAAQLQKLIKELDKVVVEVTELVHLIDKDQDKYLPATSSSFPSSSSFSSADQADFASVPSMFRPPAPRVTLAPSTPTTVVAGVQPVHAVNKHSRLPDPALDPENLRKLFAAVRGQNYRSCDYFCKLFIPVKDEEPREKQSGYPELDHEKLRQYFANLRGTDPNLVLKDCMSFLCNSASGTGNHGEQVEDRQEHPEN